MKVREAGRNVHVKIASVSDPELLVSKQIISESEEKSDSLAFAKFIQQPAQNIFTLLQNLLIWPRTRSGKNKHPPDIVDIDEIISTVLRNLMINAIKFTDKGGTITVKANIKKTNLNFSVSDTGIGIDEKHINQLFSLEKSYSSKGTNDKTGTGMGLVICKEFIDIHKGKIWAESTPGKGSTFYFMIPAGLDSFEL